ncbi:rho GTPase-activating protein 27 isoform X2 [Pungitius pungitius]|uniref:rho GTPase-activating protein 27 isoform X2 n=1 Tax=Pungitius pungitius TaxID=134920 RepID=UPI002E0E1A6C
MELVSVLHEFEYTAKDGRLVSIKPDESYVLLSRTNEHWWHVRRDQRTRPFYVPVQYVKALAPPAEDARPRGAATRASAPGASSETRRFSTFGYCEKKSDVALRDSAEEEPTPGGFTRHPTEAFPYSSGHLEAEGPLYARPHPAPKAKTRTSQPDERVEQQHAFVPDEDVDYPLPPNSPIYNTIPELNIPKSSELPGPVASNDTLMIEQQTSKQDAKVTPSTDGDSSEQVQNESLRSAVYVNVAQLRQSVSESPPPSPDAFCPPPPRPDPEGWEVHVDGDSGQEYYYHPATGRTTWDNPFPDSPTDPEPPPSPSPPQSPAPLSPGAAPRPAWTSDWEQLVDESSGCAYFYNAMSGETSWEPPEELSPYPPPTEPMSVHRFLEDGPEDYPSQDHPEACEDPLAAAEYTLAHVGRTVIPRASLDRSAPTGWNLSVEPNGTWVFTNEHSPEQWIKSVDDRGQTYFYLRDSSRSQWVLPEVPAAGGQFRTENGDEASIGGKNWRHTMAPGQLGSALDDGSFVPTHRRNTSDYSSDSSSAGNSPETQQNAFGSRPWRNPYYLTSKWLRYNVQNLEKAGILNKTKVCENGKKVRKNWAQTWTVLHGGVLTFHKDPKSASTGALHKTNQIVPEVTVDLRGASIGRASKDKSSKKNVLELKSRNGVEYLIQYDTESIITDWHKVLVDTIRQLEYLDHPTEEVEGNIYEKIAERDEKVVAVVDKRRPSRQSVTLSSSSAGDTDQKRVRTKLMKFLMKRPTLQAVKEKGYIRDNVFGCHLATLCAQEKTTVPSFVEKCINAVEKRGLDIDGLYRVSGNLAVIQKLRFKADHEELDLEDGQWEDVHVITGALKLFFRELPEPLFPFSHFNNFIAAIRTPDYKTKVSRMNELVKSLPSPNHDTMKLLFGHLRRVIQFGEDNRMTVQNVAIVFGPTLLRPEMEASNITMHMVFQNQIVELILNEYERFFYSS